MKRKTPVNTANRFLPPPEAAEKYCVSKKTVLRLAKEAGATHRIGARTIRIDCQALDAWICQQ